MVEKVSKISFNEEKKDFEISRSKLRKRLEWKFRFPWSAWKECWNCKEKAEFLLIGNVVFLPQINQILQIFNYSNGKCLNHFQYINYHRQLVDNINNLYRSFKEGKPVNQCVECLVTRRYSGGEGFDERKIDFVMLYAHVYTTFVCSIQYINVASICYRIHDFSQNRVASSSGSRELGNRGS